MHEAKFKNEIPYAGTVLQFYQEILKIGIPPPIQKLYNASFLFGPHKVPEDMTKLRPIAIGDRREEYSHQPHPNKIHTYSHNT